MNNKQISGCMSHDENKLRNASEKNHDPYEWDHLKLTDEVGDLLFAVVNYARHLKVQPEIALNRTTERFIRRFSDVERIAANKQLDLQDLTLKELDQLWDQAKKSEERSDEVR